jgi:hypothetical protein
LLKWSRKASIVKVDPHLLDLRRSIKDPLINNNFIKADILVASFFPKTKAVDLSNINMEAIIK